MEIVTKIKEKKHNKSVEIDNELRLLIKNFYRKGELLFQIRENRLFTDLGHETFPQYYQSLSLSRDEVSRLISCHILSSFFLSKNISLPPNSFLFRALIKVKNPRLTPDFPKSIIKFNQFQFNLPFWAEIWVNYLDWLKEFVEFELNSKSFKLFVEELFWQDDETDKYSDDFDDQNDKEDEIDEIENFLELVSEVGKRIQIIELDKNLKEQIVVKLNSFVTYLS